MSVTRGWLGLLVVLPAVALGSVVKKLSLEELAAASPVIVRAQVIREQVHRDDVRSRIHTFTELRVVEALKGGGLSTTLLVREAGGEADGVREDVAGAARFAAGEDVLLFLEHPRDDATLYVVMGMSSGKVRFEKAATGELRAVRDLEGLALFDATASGEKRFTVADREDLGQAETFLSRVRKAVTNRGAR